MKGLLLKDIYNMRKVGKQYLLILLFFTCYCFFLKNPSFFPMMTVMSFSMLVLTTMGYDEAAGFDKYALTLPLNREDLVRAKYLLLVLLLVFSFVLGMLGSTLIGLFMQGIRSRFWTRCFLWPRWRLSFFWSMPPYCPWCLSWEWRKPA